MSDNTQLMVVYAHHCEQDEICCQRHDMSKVNLRAQKFPFLDGVL